MEPIMGEIRMFGGTFAPRGWAFCDGQLMSIAQNTALFSILGTTYGGDGRATFALPDMRGRVPMHTGAGAGPGLSQRTPGETLGVENVTLVTTQIPAHGHSIAAAAAEQTTDRPGAGLAHAPGGSYGPAAMTESTGPVGGSQPHNNMQPSLGVEFIIALEGIYPSRN